MVLPSGSLNGQTRQKPTAWQWLGSCGLGAFLGIGVAGITMLVVNRWLAGAHSEDAQMLALSVMLLGGVAEGALIGFFQWRVLKRGLPGLTAKSWIGITILAAVIGWGLGMMPTDLLNQPTQAAADGPSVWMKMLGGIGMGLVSGALFGLLQNMVLKHLVTNQWQWPLYNTLGWGVAMGWISLGAGLTAPEWSPAALIAVAVLAIGLAGISIGAITGVFLQQKNVLTPSKRD